MRVYAQDKKHTWVVIGITTAFTLELSIVIHIQLPNISSYLSKLTHDPSHSSAGSSGI